MKFTGNGNPLENILSRNESMKGEVTPPPGESLLDPDQKDSLWPDEIRNNPDLRSQAEKRRELAKGLDALFSAIPTTTEINDAIEKKLITPEAVKSKSHVRIG
jgi:hypothetical protein